MQPGRGLNIDPATLDAGAVASYASAAHETISIRPQPAPGQPAYRWHWDTPLVMSPHDPRVIYAAANKVFRSADRGLSWTVISPDLTESPSRDEIVTMGVKGSDVRFSRNDGISQWPAITSLAESPVRTGVLYAGTDDGNVSVTRDMGRSWTRITDRRFIICYSVWNM